MRGRIALARRGTCFIRQKAQFAARAGAIALLVYNPVRGPIDATLGDPDASTIPVGAIEERIATSLLGGGRPTVSITIRTEKRRTTSQNVVAATHGQSGQVLMIGAHLDSVGAGSGMNDNASGVAAVLELARVLKLRAPTLSVRFGFWGAEELGLIGSRAYVSTVERAPLVGYLNFDMMGSRSGSAGVYEGPFAEPMLAYLRDKVSARIRSTSRGAPTTTASPRSGCRREASSPASNRATTRPATASAASTSGSSSSSLPPLLWASPRSHPSARQRADLLRRRT